MNTLSWHLLISTVCWTIVIEVSIWHSTCLIVAQGNIFCHKMLKYHLYIKDFKTNHNIIIKPFLFWKFLCVRSWLEWSGLPTHSLPFWKISRTLHSSTFWFPIRSWVYWKERTLAPINRVHVQLWTIVTIKGWQSIFLLKFIAITPHSPCIVVVLQSQVTWHNVNIL